MLARSLIAGAAGCLLLASTAFAAETSTTSTATDASFHGTWRASKVVGLSVYNGKNENIGSINDLLMDKNGSIKAAVISVGGFLGMGSRLVALPYEKIKFSTEPVAYTGTSSNAPGASGAAKPASSTTTGSTAKPPATESKPNPWYPDHAMFDATKDELKNMPEFKYSTD